MSRVNPKIDLVFKKLFGSEENKDLLLSLVNAILYPQPQIAELSLKNPYNVSDYAEGKLSILDIKAQDEHGVWYDIEMQLKGTGFYGKRTLYYWAKMFGSQLDYLTDEEREQRSRRGYSELSKCIVISLMDFVFFPDDRYHRCYLLKDRDNNETHPDLDYLDLYFVELDKFDKGLKIVQTTLERWISFLNNAYRYTRDTLPQELAEVQEIKKASAKLDIMYLDEQERIYYESQQKFWLDESSRLMEMEAKMEAAEKAAAEAERVAAEAEKAAAEARQALEKAGEEAAAAIEKAENEAQQKRNLEIAKEALAAGLPVQVVAQITGLSPEQIENLQNEIP
jgi:predicted transposase/invertase (TIGR01784 family)